MCDLGLGVFWSSRYTGDETVWDVEVEIDECLGGL